MDPFAAVFGRLHPLVLHLPIGLIVGVVVVEVVGAWRSRQSGAWHRRAAPPLLLWLNAAAALAAAATGLVLAREDAYGGPTLDLHQWLGIGVAGIAVLAATLRTLAVRRPGGGRQISLAWYRGALLAMLGLVGAAGHLGAAITHGENFLFEPFTQNAARDDEAEVNDPPALPVASAPFAPEGFAAVSPILAQHCNACHSGSRAKGGLALDSFDALARGGSSGPSIAPDAPQSSELLRRVLLPVEDDEHMPPRGKRQLSADDLAVLQAWASGGSAITSADPAPAEAEQAPTPAAPAAPAPSDPAAVAALRATLAHIAPMAADSHLLWIDLSSAVPPLEEARMIELLRPLATHVGELTLARCRITDATATLTAEMPNLRRLNLHGTGVSDATVAALAGHAALRELVLTGTNVSDAAVDGLLALPALERVYLWNAKLTPAGLERLRSARAGLLADAGEATTSAVLTVEPEPKLTNAAAEPPAAPPSLAAVNATCPVSGQPVQPQYLVVYEGRVIGFCCPDCPKQFWADPAKYLANLK